MHQGSKAVGSDPILTRLNICQWPHDPAQRPVVCSYGRVASLGLCPRRPLVLSHSLLRRPGFAQCPIFGLELRQCHPAIAWQRKRNGNEKGSTAFRFCSNKMRKRRSKVEQWAQCGVMWSETERKGERGSRLHCVLFAFDEIHRCYAL